MMCHRQQPQHPVLGSDAQRAVGGRQSSEKRVVAEDHALAAAGGARGEAKISRAQRAEGGVLGAVDGHRHPRAQREAGLLLLHDVVQLRPLQEGVEDGAAVILRDRDQTGVGRQDPEGQLDEAAPLSRHQPAAIRRTHALGAQALGVRLEDPHQLAGADRPDAPLAIVDQESGLLGRARRLLADPIDDVHGSPRPARSRILPRTSRAGTAASAMPASAASAAAIPDRLARRQRGADHAQRAERLVARRQAAARHSEARMGAAHQRSQRDRARSSRVLELRATMIVPQLDRPGRNGDLVVLRAPREHVVARERDDPVESSGLAHADPARPGHDPAASRRPAGCAPGTRRPGRRSPAPAARARRAAPDRAARRGRPRASARSASRRPRPPPAAGRTSTDPQPSGRSPRANRSGDGKAEPQTGEAAQLGGVDARPAGRSATAAGARPGLATAISAPPSQPRLRVAARVDEHARREAGLPVPRRARRERLRRAALRRERRAPRPRSASAPRAPGSGRTASPRTRRTREAGWEARTPCPRARRCPRRPPRAAPRRSRWGKPGCACRASASSAGAVEAADGVHEGIADVAAEDVAPFDQQRARAAPGGGDRRGDAGRSPADDRDIEVGRRGHRFHPSRSARSRSRKIASSRSEKTPR